MTCEKCNGEGVLDHAGWKVCPDCLGKGEVPKPGTDQLRLECDDQAELPV